MNNDTNRIWSPNFTFLVISNGFFFAGFHMLLPTIPLLATQMGGSKTEIGLIAGIFVLSSITTRLFTDFCVKTFGKRNCLLSGVVISLLSSGAYLLAPSVGTLLWIRILHGAGFGIGTTFYIAIIAEIIPPNRRGEGLGYFGLATTVAMAVAPATGLWLIEAFGFPAMFLTSVGFELVALLWLGGCSFPPHTAPIAADPVVRATFGRRRKNFMDILVERGTLLPAALTLLFGIGYGSVLNFIAVYANEKQIPNPGSFFILGTTCIFLSRVFVGRVYDKKGPAWIMLPGGLLFLGGLALIAAVTSTFSFLTAAALYGLGVGMLFPALQTEVINAVSADRRSAASATFSNALDIGLGGGSVLLGLFAQQTGLSTTYLCAAAVIVLFLLVYTCHLALRRGLLDAVSPLEEE